MKRTKEITKNLDELKATIPAAKGLDGETIPAPVFVGQDLMNRDRLMLSAEHETSFYFADYYGEFRNGGPWVSPALEKWATDTGHYWEWVSPGSLMLLPA